ncbi:hypothetical protein IC230_17690 [Spirosoma sp. BT704]|uniref:Uncharacterized protein n=1 Tax=Spirosoma validum TaxID=2771355 RepID=A0A927B3U4_9BACT|nr:hypothetical protein [Spirosoma validum]
MIFTTSLACLLVQCKSTNGEFSPGAGDSRITGTWQLLERRFSKDSTFTIRVKRDSLAIAQDTSKNKLDSIYIRRDTSFYTTRRYSRTPPQILTFDVDGKLTGSGTEMTYYSPIKYYNVDKTYADSLLINFFISTNRANVPFQQGVEFRKDTLVLKPRCDQPCYSKLLRVR